MIIRLIRAKQKRNGISDSEVHQKEGEERKGSR